MAEKSTVFETLVKLNVNGHTETKNTGNTSLTYLSWSWAWSEVKKLYPDASYEIIRDPDTHLPYVYDEKTGYMVFTSVTIEGITHTMWLPVMDGQNRAMKSEAYTIPTKYREIVVQPATMFDINKTLMRCLVKNLAMFGLGLYIYAGEDLPEDDDSEAVKPVGKKPAAPKQEEYGEPKFKCSSCGKELKPYIGASGDEVSIRQHVAWSDKKFGKTLCVECAKKELGK